jgi:metal-responsive CopG/Arc/MetJ family transcriptional regulator
MVITMNNKNQRITISLENKVFETLEIERGLIKRSSFINNALKEAFSESPTGGIAE